VLSLSNKPVVADLWDFKAIQMGREGYTILDGRTYQVVRVQDLPTAPIPNPSGPSGSTHMQEVVDAEGALEGDPEYERIQEIRKYMVRIAPCTLADGERWATMLSVRTMGTVESRQMRIRVSLQNLCE
jgi:hypothetical protein